MTHVYFHCSSHEGVLLDEKGSQLESLSDVRHHAERYVRTLVANPGLEDWREWMLFVSDEEGEEILEVPFTSFLGKMQ